ncbi:MAG: hypothetical protein EHM61_10350 [Acidobacteria bacterium]|nr:MAG: hypothetical protein EHM61_10350 [Acidobacteriota bacterium]
MYDSLMVWRIPIVLMLGIVAGWFGARNELRIVRGGGRANGSGLLLRMRTLQYALSFYLIFSVLAFCGSGLYAARFWQTLIPTRGLFAYLMPASIQTLTTGAMVACASALHFIRSFSDKYGMDLW